MITRKYHLFYWNKTIKYWTEKQNFSYMKTLSIEQLWLTTKQAHWTLNQKSAMKICDAVETYRSQRKKSR